MSIIFYDDNDYYNIFLRFVWHFFGFYAKIRNGSVAEWLKAHDSKSCGLQSLGGSNPLASATAPEAVFFGSGSRALRSMRILSLPPGSIGKYPEGIFFNTSCLQEGGFGPKVRIERSEILILSLPPFL